MTIIKLCGQQLKLSAPVIAADTIDYIEMAVDMSEDWQRMDAVFVRCELDNYYVEAQVRDGRIRKEQHLNLTRGSWRVSAYGVRSSGEDIIERITSTTATLDVKVTGAHGGEPLPPDPGDIVERLKAQIAGKLDKKLDAEDAGKVLGIDDTGYIVPVAGGGGSAGEPGKPAIIGSNGNWMIWDIERGEYVDSGKPSRGADGAPGRDGADGAPGRDGVDGAPGRDGADGRDGYTPVKGVDYFDGAPGRDGVDGYTPVKGVDYFDGAPGRDGIDGAPGRDGVDGAPGADGTSVTVASVSESTESGGTNTVTFSDGKQLHIRNGKDGQGGGGGEISIDSITESTESGGKNTVTFSDGKTLTVKNGVDASDIRVCAFNVGNFSLGASGDPAGTDEMKANFDRTFDKCNADVYLFSEWDANFTADGSVKSLTAFADIAPYWSKFTGSTADKYFYQKIAAKYEPENEYAEFYGPSKKWHFVDVPIQVKGRTVHCISTQCQWQYRQYRINELERLLKYIADNNIEYFVLGGDFNFGLDGEGQPSFDVFTERTLEEIAIFKDAGYKSVQTSSYGNSQYNGFIDTYPKHYGYPLKPYDNIFYSPNLELKNVFTVDYGASDHYALCADFTIADGDDGVKQAFESHRQNIVQMLRDRLIVKPLTRNVLSKHYNPVNGEVSGDDDVLNTYRRRYSKYAYVYPVTYMTIGDIEIQPVYFDFVTESGGGESGDMHANVPFSRVGEWSNIITVPPLMLFGVNVRKKGNKSIVKEDITPNIYTLRNVVVDAFPTTPNSNDIPTTKAVADYVDSVIGGIENGTY